MTIAGFHIRMALLLAGFVVATAIVSAAAGIHVQDAVSLLVAVLLVTAGLSPIPAYAHQSGRIGLRESSAALLWALAFAVVLPLSVEALGRLGRPLQDAHFAILDRSLGISVPAIAGWAGRHTVGRALNFVYGLLIPWIPVAAFAVGLSGQWLRARIFVAANVIAFAIGLPLFVLFPAIGPWYGSALAPTAFQLQCQNSLLSLRAGGAPIAIGVVCFPSFHVVWAILCAYAFSGFRWLRIPGWLLGIASIVSKVTTGWHYFVDVLAGLVIAAIALRLARGLATPHEDPANKVTTVFEPDSAVI